MLLQGELHSALIRNVCCCSRTRERNLRERLLLERPVAGKFWWAEQHLTLTRQNWVKKSNQAVH